MSDSGFTGAVDIANSALQKLGQERILAFTDPTKAAEETAFCYNKLRMAEMQRNVWRWAIRRAVLRAIDSNTMLYTPPVYSSTTTYNQGEIVTFTDSLSITLWYFSRMAANTGNQPDSFGQPWQNYFGSMYASLYDSTQSYFPGEIVYEQPTPGTLNAYLSLMENQTDDPGLTTPDAWDSTITYRVGAIVSENGSNYISLINENLNFDPATEPTAWQTTALATSYQWVPLTGTLSPIALLFPLDSGPVEQTFTRNAYPLPYGFLRTAPQDPKAGAVSILGAPTNDMVRDWMIESDFIVTMESEAIVFRFAANISDVARMHPMFCEGLACRIALNCCETLTQSTQKLATNMKLYAGFMGEARALNAVEVGYDEPPLDDYIATRM